MRQVQVVTGGPTSCQSLKFILWGLVVSRRPIQSHSVLPYHHSNTTQHITRHIMLDTIPKKNSTSSSHHCFSTPKESEGAFGAGRHSPPLESGSYDDHSCSSACSNTNAGDHGWIQPWIQRLHYKKRTAASSLHTSSTASNLSAAWKVCETRPCTAAWTNTGLAFFTAACKP